MGYGDGPPPRGGFMIGEGGRPMSSYEAGGGNLNDNPFSGCFSTIVLIVIIMQIIQLVHDCRNKTGVFQKDVKPKSETTAPKSQKENREDSAALKKTPVKKTSACQPYLFQKEKNSNCNFAVKRMQRQLAMRDARMPQKPAARQFSLPRKVLG